MSNEVDEQKYACLVDGYGWVIVDDRCGYERNQTEEVRLVPTGGFGPN